MPYKVLDPAQAAPAPIMTLGEPKTSVGATLQSMQSELFLQLGGREDIDDPRLAKWINWAYLDLWSSLKLEESIGSYGFDTVEGQALYLVPGQVSSTMGAAILDDSLPQGGRPLDKTDLRTYRMLEAHDGAPEYYFRLHDMLVFYPTPDEIESVAIDIRFMPVELAAINDSPILEPQWHEAIVLNARTKAFSALLEWTAAAAAQNDYVNFMRRRQDPEEAEQDSKIIRSSVPREVSRGNPLRKSYRPPRFD